MPSFQSNHKPRRTVGRLLALTAGFLFFSTAVTASAAPGFIGSLDIGNTIDKLPENTLSGAYEGHTSRHGAHLSNSRVFRRVAAPFPQDDEECDEDGMSNCPKAAETCISYSDRACPANSACCPRDKPNCVTVNGKPECQAAAASKTTPTQSSTARPSATAVAPTSSRITTTSLPPVVNTKLTTSKPAPTAPAPTISQKGNTNTAKSTTTDKDENTPTETPEAEAEETTELPAVIQTGTSTDILTESTSSTTTEAAESTSTETPIQDEKRKSTLAPLISGAIAGSICFFALSCVAVAAFRKKREERRLDRLSEEEAAASSRKEPMSSSAQPMGYGGTGQQLDDLPKEYVIETSRGEVFGVRDQIPPPSPPPNAMVVGTPPYRRQYSNSSQPGTPTRLGSALPPQRGYNAGMGTPGFEYQHDVQMYDEDAQFYQPYQHQNQSVASNIGIGGGSGGGGYGHGHGRPEAY